MEILLTHRTEIRGLRPIITLAISGNITIVTVKHVMQFQTSITVYDTSYTIGV